jgi:hypothetical protein
MDTIDLKGLPEPFARAVRALVETLREQLATQDKPRQKVKLATRRGRVIDKLSRTEIYDAFG